MTTDGRPAARAARRAALAAALLGMASPARALPTERYAEREGLRCTVCHVAAEGGPLTAFGRDWRWRAPLVDDGVGGDPAAGGGAGEAPGPAWYGRWSGDATLYARRGRDRAFGQRTTTGSLTETLRVRGEAIGGDERLSFRAETYAQQAAATGDSGLDDDSAGFSAAEVTWALSQRGSYVRFGRQFVVAGAAVRRVDGAALRAALGERFDLDLFGGRPSEDLLGGHDGDWVAGGRIGARVIGSLRLGASAFYAEDADDPSDGKGGLDLQWTPWRSLEFSAHGYWDWIAQELYDARARLVVTPSIAWQVALDWTHAVPGLFLPKSSLYSVFSEDPYDEGALTLTRRLGAQLAVNAFVRHTDYRGGESLTQAGGGIDARYGPNGEDSVGAEAAWQDESRSSLGGSSSDDDALFLRGWHLLWWTASLYTTLDGSVQLVRDANFGRDAALVRCAAGWDSRTWWDVQAGVDWVRDPDFEDRLDLFARLRLRF